MLAVAALALAYAPGAFAQETQPAVDNLQLLTNATPATLEAPALAQATPVAMPSLEAPVAAPVVERVAPVAPAAGVTPPRAAVWTGPLNFAPVAVVDLLTRVCRASVSGDGGSLTTQAMKLGLGDGYAAPDDLARAVPNSAITWRTPSADGEVYLMGYGEDPMNCGAAVVRPMPEVAFDNVVELLKAPALGFVTDATQTLAGNVRWERLKSPRGEFIDLMEYGASGESPGVLRADYLEE